MSTLILTQKEKNFLLEFIEMVTNQGSITVHTESSCWFGSGGSDDGGCSDCTAHCASDCFNTCTGACGDGCHVDCWGSCEGTCSGQCPESCGGTCSGGDYNINRGW